MRSASDVASAVDRSSRRSSSGSGVASIAVVLFDSSPTWALAVGTAAGMTAGTRFIFSSLMFALLIAGTAGIDAMPAAVLAAVAAWITRQALDPIERTAPAAAEQT